MCVESVSAKSERNSREEIRMIFIFFFSHIQVPTRLTGNLNNVGWDRVDLILCVCVCVRAYMWVCAYGVLCGGLGGRLIF